MAHIGINAVFLEPGRMGGVETYTRQLIRHLQAVDSPHRFKVFIGSPSEPPPIEADRWSLVRLPVNPHHRNRRILWEQFRLPRVMGRLAIDLAHFPYSSSPYLYDRPAVVSIHDSIRIQYPHLVPPVERAYRRVIESNLKQTGRHVIAVSQYDASIQQQALGLADGRISVVHYGVDERFAVDRPLDLAERADEAVWIGNPYPHKNVATLFEADRLLVGRGVTPPRLRLIGIRHPRQRQALAERAAAAGLDADRLTIESAIGHERLPEVYRQAKLLLFPSRYESFGMPVLEAMASGTPVVCGDIPAMRELFEDAAVLVDPDRPDLYADAIAELIGDRSRFLDQASRGPALAGRFSWRQCAARTHAVYERLLAARASSRPARVRDSPATPFTVGRRRHRESMVCDNGLRIGR